ncbi:GL21067 [Drosophila persimilis]|uniref:GL21067 n=1 Tax=Drosophila persimilis TaxID=7234 RepID=B4GX40_DROPE|nr:GL21067 [Drosophila persimilis]
MELCRLYLWFSVISLTLLNMALELNANTISMQSAVTEELSHESSSNEELNEETTEELLTHYSHTDIYEEKHLLLDENSKKVNGTFVDTSPRIRMSISAIAALISLSVGVAIFAGYLRYKYNHRTSYNL